jgi:pimeloyl-ACP methyl ester carboxylesterase
MRDEGARARTVVCVHGAGGGGWEWGIWARALAVSGRGVLAPDLMPASGGLAATHLADYRAQVVAWCGSSSANGVDLVGASLGGLLALIVAREVRARSLVLVNPMPPAGLPSAAAPSPAVIRWRSGASLRGTRSAMPDADHASCAYAFRRWRDESGAVLDEARAGLVVDPPACPVLVIASEHDLDVPPESSRALAAMLGADFECIAGASHVGPLLGHCAARTAARVADWLDARMAHVTSDPQCV